MFIFITKHRFLNMQAEEEYVNVSGDSFLQRVQENIPVPVRWKDGKHIASRLLAPEENTKVFKILGSKRRALATTVVQMWFATPKNSNSWNKKLLGVLCLVKDFSRTSYFIYLIDVCNESCVIQEQELYTQFKYKKVLNTFHTFEGDHCTVGLNFCDVDEATFFYQCIKERISAFKKKRAAMKAERQKKAEAFNSTIAKLDTGQSPKNGMDHETRVTKEVEWETPVVKGRRTSFSSLLSKVLKSPAKKYGSKALPKVEDKTEKDEKLLISHSSEVDAKESTGNGARYYTNSSMVGNGSDAKTENYNREMLSIDDASKDDRTMLCPSPDGAPNGRFYKSILSKSKYARQQLKYNKTVAKFKEQQKQYHSAMIRSLVSTRKAKAKQSKQRAQNNADPKDETPRKGTGIGGVGECPHTLTEKPIADKQPTQSASDFGVNAGTMCPLTSKSASGFNLTSQVLTNTSARSFSGMAIDNQSQAVSTSRSPQLKKSYTAWRRDSLDRQALRRASSISINLPLNLTARGSSISCQGSGSSFPSLPSLHKLQFPGHDPLTHEATVLSRRNSQSSLASRKSRTSANSVPLSHETDKSQSQRFSRESSQPNILDLREAVMKSIIAGKTLRKVIPDKKCSRRQSREHGSMLRDILAKAVEERNKFMRTPSDDEDENDEEGDEWFDDKDFEDDDENDNDEDEDIPNWGS